MFCDLRLERFQRFSDIYIIQLKAERIYKVKYLDSTSDFVLITGSLTRCYFNLKQSQTEVILKQLEMRTADFTKTLANFSINVLVKRFLCKKKSTQNKSGRLIEEMLLTGEYHQYYHILH